jgi:IPT/TIG domain
VPVPTGATSGNVLVTVRGGASNGLPFTVIPSISSLSPTSGPAGSTVTIAGTGFGLLQGTSTVTFNGTLATPTSWSATILVVPVPGGATPGNVVVTVGGVTSNGVLFTATPPPTITSLSLGSGPVGTPVTVNGANFGASQGSSTVTFNGTMATPTSWSATSITVPVPAGATRGNVVVTVSGVASNGASFIVTPPPPSITSLSPISGPVGTSVIITGANFGASQGTNTVAFNGTTATFVGWTDTSISAPVPSGATTGNVVVTVGGLASNGVNFSVTPPPAITSLNPTSGMAGTPVTITGTNFGATQGTSTVAFNGAGATPTSWSDTSVNVSVPAAAATTGVVVVTRSGVASNGVNFTVLPSPPSITNLNPNSGGVLNYVTISGANFGSSRGSSTVTFNGTPDNPNFSSWNSVSITTLVPAGATTGSVVVTVGGQPSNGVLFTVTKPTPTITSLNPTLGPVGTTVTITGTNFAASQGTSTVTFNGTAATPTSWATTSITVPVPAGATTGNIVVTVGGVASNAVAFAVTPPPSITSLSPTFGQVGTSVTITGTSFGTTQGTSTVTFNGVSATPTSWSATSIVASVPTTSTSNVVVTVSGVASNGVSFTVLAPSITTVNPTSGPLGTSVTITGAGFGSTQGSSTVAFSGVLALPTSWSATSITVPVPAGAITGNIVVTVVGMPSNGVNFAITAPPSITSLNPASGVVGASVTITGANFGASQGTSAVTFNGMLATPSSWSTGSITVPVPSGASTGNVVVTVGGAASNGVPFSVNSAAPSIALVQHTSKDAGTSSSSTLAFNVSNAAGNFIAVVVRAGKSGQVFSVSDSRSNVYKQAVQFNMTVDGETLGIFYAENIAGGANTITISDTILGTMRFAILEYSGVATSNSLDVTAAAEGTSASPATGTVTTNFSGDLLLGAIVTANPANFSAGSGYTIEESVPAEPNTKLIVEDQRQPIAGTASAGATLGTSDHWGAVVAAFRHP